MRQLDAEVESRKTQANVDIIKAQAILEAARLDGEIRRIQAQIESDKIGLDLRKLDEAESIRRYIAEAEARRLKHEEKQIRLNVQVEAPKRADPVVPFTQCC